MNLDLKQSPEINVDVTRIKQMVVNFIVPLIALIIIAILAASVIYPTHKKLPELETDLEAKRMLDERLQQKLSSLNNLVDFKASLDENSDLVNAVLVSEAMVPELLTQVHQIAVESGMAVSKLSYSYTGAGASTEESASFDEVLVSLGVNGNFQQLLTFLTSMESAARLINVDTLRYAVEDDDNETTLQMSFVLKSPYLFVQSAAVTDDPITLDIQSQDFQDMMAKVKSLRFYNITAQDVNEEIVMEAEETTPSITDSITE